MRATYHSAILLGAAITLSGCASFDGVPEPVLPPDSAARMATVGDYSAEAALEFARDSHSEEEYRRFRDALIAIQIAAIDARYMEFRTKLSREMKGANFGLDLAVLGLTSGGSFAAQRTANILSAGAAGFTGSKASLSKEVYFEKALPALIASMDARRLRAKTLIIEKMRTKSAADYSIAEAIVDLSAYQQAASLDGAIEQVTTNAAQDKADAQRVYENLVETCTVEAGVADIWEDIVTALNAPGVDKAVLDQVSAVMGTSTDGSLDDQKQAILTKLGTSYCAKGSAETLSSMLRLKTGLKLP